MACGLNVAQHLFCINHELRIVFTDEYLIIGNIDSQLQLSIMLSSQNTHSSRCLKIGPKTFGCPVIKISPSSVGVGSNQEQELQDLNMPCGQKPKCKTEVIL